MNVKTGNLRRYRLKDEYKTLFESLSGGETLTPKEAFQSRRPGVPVRKSYESEEEYNRMATVLESLLKAGFVDADDQDVSFLDKP